jgi:polysaccharide biosynthesis/export protein
VPRSPYQLRTSDVLAIDVLGTLPNAPVAGAFAIQPGGIVNLGLPLITVSLLEMSGKQQIAGQHLVGPGGTVTLACYGSVAVVGMTLAQAKVTIEAHLRQYLEDPEVTVDVFAYNSRVFYVITQGAGVCQELNGESVP